LLASVKKFNSQGFRPWFGCLWRGTELDKNQTVLRFCWVAFAILFWASFSPAQETFGAEFTFTNPQVRYGQKDPFAVRSPESERHRDMLAQHILRRCQGCWSEEGRNQYGVKTWKILYPDGFYFVIATDPGVVEVQMKPLTVREIERHLVRIQNDLFDSAEDHELVPDDIGAGHIHMGLQSSIGSDVRLFRNLLVDMANHPELSHGLLAPERNGNALSFVDLSTAQQAAFARVISEVDRGQIRDVQTLAQRLNTEVYNVHPEGWSPPAKFRDLTLLRAADPQWQLLERTLEFRGIQSQANAKEFFLLSQLFSGRMAYLRRLQQPLSLQPPEASLLGSPARKLQRFADYVAEAGLDFRSFARTYSFHRTDAMNPHLIGNIVPISARNFFCEKVLTGSH